MNTTTEFNIEQIRTAAWADFIAYVIAADAAAAILPTPGAAARARTKHRRTEMRNCLTAVCFDMILHSNLRKKLNNITPTGEKIRR